VLKNYPRNGRRLNCMLEVKYENWADNLEKNMIVN